MKKIIIMGVLVLLCATLTRAQTVRASQFATVSQRIANTTVSVDYSRPVARGRTLFGPEGIVKYGKIWMPGANEASFLKTSSDLMISGKPLKAGSYSFWTIPGDKKWTLILSTDWDQWHTRYPGKDKDAVRFEVKPDKGAHMETLAFYFPVVTANSATLRLHWGSTIIPIEIKLS